MPRFRSFAAGLALAATIPAVSLQADFPRIRALDPGLAQILVSGYARSPTFKRLVDRVQQSDIVVHLHVLPVGVRRSRIAGALRFVTHAGGVRYLRIGFRAGLPEGVAIALLGHELQHAAEVADAPAVLNHAAFEALYRRIGERCHGALGPASYDTPAAREAQRRIAAELRDSETRTVARR